jgi:hypothetical protein
MVIPQAGRVAAAVVGGLLILASVSSVSGTLIVSRLVRSRLTRWIDQSARTHYALGSGTSTLDTMPDLYAAWERWAAGLAGLRRVAGQLRAGRLCGGRRRRFRAGPVVRTAPPRGGAYRSHPSRTRPTA